MNILSGLPAYLNFIFVALGAILIGLIVYLLRKYVPAFKPKEEKKETEEEIVNDNLQSKLMTNDEENPFAYLDEDERLIKEDEEKKEEELKKNLEKNKNE